MSIVVEAMRTRLRIVVRQVLFIGLACLLPLAIVPTTTVMASTGGGPAARTQALAQDWYMVIDRAGILDQTQERVAINDAYRLFLNGIPTQVVTEFAALSQDQADARARELRITRGIESSRGANDGLLLYAAVNPRDRASIVISISVGGTTLPAGGLTRQSLQELRESVLAPQLDVGNPARAITYTLRELIYLKLYVPPAVNSVTGLMTTLRGALDVAGPAIALFVVAWLGWLRTGGSSSGRLTARSLFWAALTAVCIAIPSVPAQSTLGVFSGLALGLVVVWQAIVFDARHSSSARRRLTVTPRVPGSRASSILRSRSGFR